MKLTLYHLRLGVFSFYVEGYPVLSRIFILLTDYKTKSSSVC